MLGAYPATDKLTASDNSSSSSRRWKLLGVILTIGIVGIVLAVARTAEVVREGQLRPYASGSLREIHVVGVDLVIDAETRRGLDVLNSFLLALIAGVALLAFLAARSCQAPASVGAHRRRPATMYALAAVGASYYALDELLGIHETIGHNMTWLLHVPGIAHPDDAIFVLLAIPVMVYLLFYREALFRTTRQATLLFVAGFCCAATALGSDLAASSLEPLGFSLEDALEAMASGLILAGFTSVTLITVRSTLSGSR